jgi:hypothetical protein
MTMTRELTKHSPAKRGDDPHGARAICDALYLFRICPKPACGRMGACRRNPEMCIRRHARIVPEEVWEWVAGILEARELGLTLKQTMVMIEPLEGAYFSWIAGVEAGLAARAKRT